MEALWSQFENVMAKESKAEGDEDVAETEKHRGEKEIEG